MTYSSFTTKSTRLATPMRAIGWILLLLAPSCLLPLHHIWDHPSPLITSCHSNIDGGLISARCLLCEHMAHGPIAMEPCFVALSSPPHAPELHVIRAVETPPVRPLAPSNPRAPPRLG